MGDGPWEAPQETSARCSAALPPHPQTLQAQVLRGVCSLHLQPLHEGTMLWRGQSLTQYLYDGRTIELQQSMSMEPEPRENPRSEDPIRIHPHFLIRPIL